MPVLPRSIPTILVGGTTDRGQWAMETPAWPHHAAPGDPVMSLKMAENSRCKRMERPPFTCSRDAPEGNNNKRGERATMEQWRMENFPCGSAAWKPDSGNTTRVLGAFPPMENGEHLPTQGEPGDASHFITDYCLAGGMGNGEWRKISARCFPGQGSWGNVQLGAANAPSSAMEWTMAPGKMESNL